MSAAAIRAIELFGCAGGMAEGFRQAGIEFDLAFDHDPEACASYSANIGRAPVQIDVRSLSRLVVAGWLPRKKFDLLVADPPCTPWSRAGKRQGLADHRDLLAVTCEMIAMLRPRYWLVGNLPGLDDSTNWETVQDVIGGVGGYCVDYLRLDAADFGVPQRRVRPFWFGHPVESGHLTHPRPTHCDPAELETLHIPGFEMHPWVTVRSALEHLSLAELGTPVRVRWKSQSRAPSTLDAPGKVVPSSQPGNRGAVLSIGANQPAKMLALAASGDGALLELPRTLKRHPRHPINRGDAPAFTITARDAGGAQGGRSLEWPWDTAVKSAANAVKLSELAASLLQGFPAGWKFVGKTKRSRWAQIGQAMPPPLARAVATQIVRLIAGVPARRELELGA